MIKDSIEEAIGSYKEYKQTKVAQMNHNWQYIGGRKGLMKDGVDLCPAGCDEV